MAQASNTSFDSRNSDPHKAVDCIFAIAGWPTVYSVVKSDYTLAGDLANFTSIRKWANFPSGASAKVKGRPEEGHMTLGQMDIEVQDKVENGVRAISDLLARQSYLEGTSTCTINQLNGRITRADTTITVDSTTGFAASGTIHIGLERSE